MAKYGKTEHWTDALKDQIGDRVEQVRKPKVVKLAKDMVWNPNKTGRSSIMISEFEGYPIKTMHAFISEIEPGGNYGPHRHSSEAIMMCLEGEAAMVIDGVRYEYRPGDCIIVPAMSWHQHLNPSETKKLRYFVVSNWALTKSLGLPILEDHEMFDQTDYSLEAEMQGKDRGPGEAEAHRGHWTDALRDELHEAKVQTHGAKIVKFAKDMEWSPNKAGRSAIMVSGFEGFAVKTMHSFVSEIKPGGNYGPHRHSSEAIMYCISGEAYTVIDGVRYDWKAGDCLMVPSLSWHQHFNASDTEVMRYYATSNWPMTVSAGLGNLEDHKLFDSLEGTIETVPVPAT